MLSLKEREPVFLSLSSLSNYSDVNAVDEGFSRILLNFNMVCVELQENKMEIPN